MPRICRSEPGQQVFYALGYGGNGVSYSARILHRWDYLRDEAL